MSVKPILDAWIICDNGSNKQVLSMIEECLSDIPGKIIQTTWVDFGTNRTEALQESRFFAQEMFPNDTCYAFTIDADEELKLPQGYRMPDLDGGALFGYLMRLGNVHYPRPNFLCLNFGWEFKGEMHEELVCHQDGVAQGILSGPFIEVRQEGKRSKDPLRYYKDSETLKNAYAKDPRPRYLFYRAQALRGAKMEEAAIHVYKQYIQTNSVAEEVWYAKLCVGRLMIDQGYPESDIVMMLTDALNDRPWRVEPIATLAQYWRVNQKKELAYWAASHARKIEPCGDLFFAESIWFNGMLDEELAMTAFATGRYPDVVDACTKLLQRPDLSDREIERVQINLHNALTAISAEAPENSGQMVVTN